MSTADIAANAQLVLREREGRDRCWWAQALDCFHPDSTVNVGWFEGSGADFVAGSEKMAASGGGAAHRLAPPIVHLHGDRAVVVLGAVIISRAMIDGQELDLEADIRIVYRTERRKGVWRIANMDCVYERDRLTPAVLGRPFAVPESELKDLRPSYRMLAWSFGRRGIPVRGDLLGDDEPHQVDDFCQKAFAWAGLAYPPKQI
jgi:SnoaL-like protein